MVCPAVKWKGEFVWQLDWSMGTVCEDEPLGGWRAQDCVHVVCKHMRASVGACECARTFERVPVDAWV